MPDMIAMLRAPGPRVSLVHKERVTLESHDMELTRKRSDRRWALVLRSSDPEDKGEPCDLLCAEPGHFYAHPTDPTLYLTLFDPDDREELEKYTLNVVRLTQRLIRESLGH
jgi:hypothetical protein